MGNQSSRENTKETELLSKWSSNEQEQLSQKKELPCYFSSELYVCFTEHTTQIEYLEAAYKLVKLKDPGSIYPVFQACIHKYNASLETFVSWTIASAIPLWFGDDQVKTDSYDSTRLVNFLLYNAKEQEKQKSSSMDWLLEKTNDRKELDEVNDWKLKSACSPSQISASEFMDWLNSTPSIFRLVCLAAEYAFLGSNDRKVLHKRRIDRLASPQLGSLFSELLSPFDYFMLTQYLPSHSLSSDTIEIAHQVLFSSKRDGISWQVFVDKIVGKGATLIVIKSKDGTVFGGYADDVWEYQKTDWYGNASNFLFRLNPQGGVWLGQSTNSHYQYLCWGKKSLPNGFGMGGQFDYCGLWIDSDFLHGHSRAGPFCSTFKSPQLTESDTFLVDQVEVWLMRPVDKEEEEANGKGVLNYSEDMEFMEMAGKKMYSKDLGQPEKKK